jgi:hypothetical protein
MVYTKAKVIVSSVGRLKQGVREGQGGGGQWMPPAG